MLGLVWLAGVDFESWVAHEINPPRILLPYPGGWGGDFGSTVGRWKPLGYHRPTLEHAPPKPTWAFLIFQTTLLHSWLQWVIHGKFSWTVVMYNTNSDGVNTEKEYECEEISARVPPIGTWANLDKDPVAN